MTPYITPEQFQAQLAADLASGVPGTPETVAAQQMELYGEVSPEVVEQVDPEVYQAGFPLIPLVLAAAKVAPYAAKAWPFMLGAGSFMAGLTSGLWGKPGGDGMVMQAQKGLQYIDGVAIDGVPILPNGVPEPPPAMVAKEWSIPLHTKYAGSFRMYFFRLIDGRIMCYHPYKGWKIWRPKKPLAVLYRGKTTLSQAVKVQKYLDGIWKTVAKKTKALKLA